MANAKFNPASAGREDFTKLFTEHRLTDQQINSYISQLNVEFATRVGPLETEVHTARGEYPHLDDRLNAMSGGGGTTDYTELSSKPKINGIELIGNKALDDFGIQAKTSLPPDGSQDMSSEIMSKLQREGICQLEAGDYYVSGITMPAGTMLKGCGNRTRIILIDSVVDGAAVTLKSNCIVQDVAITGGENEVTNIIGLRNGVVWSGTGVAATSPENGRVMNCNIQNFNGFGILCKNTSKGSTNFLAAVNCYINNCNGGVRTENSEFNKFLCVRTSGCFIACDNEGGNNTFVQCDFSKCTIGFMIDNTSGTYENNGHGSAIGCIFNHMGANNDGFGVVIRKTGHGFAFVGCQFFFSSVEILDASGVVFDACIFGQDISIIVNQVVSTMKKSRTIFSDCNFRTVPVTELSENTVFSNCCVRGGSNGGFMIDSGNPYRNLIEASDDSFTNKYKHYPIELEAGTYYVYFGTLTTDDTDAEVSSGGFVDAEGHYVSNNGSVSLFDRGEGVFQKFVLSDACNRLRLIPSNTQGHSEGDTLSFTNLMIIREADWAASRKYTPYRPTIDEMYSMIKDLQEEEVTPSA